METSLGYCVDWNAHKSTIAKFLIGWFLATSIPLSYRIAIFMTHVPWLGAIILSYSELFAGYKKIRKHGQARALRRIKEGSPYKDLFHHLVCYIFQFVGNNSFRE